jgi:hypothetical protein
MRSAPRALSQKLFRRTSPSESWLNAWKASSLLRHFARCGDNLDDITAMKVGVKLATITIEAYVVATKSLALLTTDVLAAARGDDGRSVRISPGLFLWANPVFNYPMGKVPAS